MENNLDTLNTLADLSADNAGLKPFVDIIQSIMELNDENLSPTVLESIKGMIKGSLTPKLKQQSIEQIIANYHNNGSTRGEVKNEIASMKATVADLVSELHPSPAKVELLNSIFNIFYEIFDEVEKCYHAYDIELPITLEEGATAPTYAHETDAAADFYASQDMTLHAHSTSNKVHTGVRIALPENWVMYIDPRSSIGAKTGLRLSNSLGVIDEDYRGEIMVLYDNLSNSDYEIKAGDRIAQGWVQPVYRFKPVVVDSLPETERGEGGFGSTGK